MSNDKVIEFPNRHPDELPPGDALDPAAREALLRQADRDQQRRMAEARQDLYEKYGPEGALEFDALTQRYADILGHQPGDNCTEDTDK